VKQPRLVAGEHEVLAARWCDARLAGIVAFDNSVDLRGAASPFVLDLTLVSRLVRPTRVLICTPDLRQGGGVTHYFRTLGLDDIEGIDYFAVNRDGTRSLVAKAWHALRIVASFCMKARSYPLIHLNPSFNRNSYYRDLVLVWLASLLRAKTLVFFRGWDERFEATVSRSPFQRALFRRTYGRATAYIVLGDYFKRRLLALGVAASKPVHVETTVASSEGGQDLDVEAKAATAPRRLKVLFLSRILREKGIYIAIDAFAACQRAQPAQPMSFHIAGSGPELEAARAYVLQKALTDIVFEGDVAGPRKAELLRRCHVLLFPTFHGEGLPNCILEGMLFGLAIVTRPVAAIPEIVEHGVNGLLGESLDAAEFATALGQLVEDPDMLRRMAVTNREVALQRFTPEIVRGRLTAIYAHMMGDACAA
jgi:glycosyltransferase involved in cell wall biosynthesis